MKVVIALLCLISVWVIYMNLRVYIKRARMHRRLREVCESKGYSLSKHTGGYYHIDMDGSTLSVRVLGARSKHSRLVFLQDGTYRFEYKFSIPLRFEQSAVFPLFGRAHTLPTDADILLLCPVCKYIDMRERNGTTVSLGNGDSVGGANLYSLSGLLAYLEKE